MTAPPAPPQRARDRGLPFPGTPGPRNAIIDVPGLAVGTWQRIDAPDPAEPVALVPGRGPVRTGVTAIVPHADRDGPFEVRAAIHALNGNGEMTGSHWIDHHGAFLGPVLITNTHAVGACHEAAVRWMVGRWPSVFVDDHGWAMPVVAETYDGFTNDIVGLHVRPEHGLAAIDAALAAHAADARAVAEGREPAPVPEGNVGGGAGMQSFGLKGGSGTASRRVGGHMLGAWVQSNFGERDQLTILGERIGPLLEAPDPFAGTVPSETGSIIVVLATDAPLSGLQLRRLAQRGVLGIGRLGGIGGNGSGDLVLALSVADPRPALGLSAPRPPVHATRELDASRLDAVFTAAIEATEEAIVNALFAARSLSTVKPRGTLHAIDAEAVAVRFARRG
ncbi:MAG: P1 family peptidase [Burkholderiaceae bacterium]|jgi:L-aminopeptidase/D-esterase-like protein|nr:P1 family peptidase [Burkholderiales bacterium]MCZ8338846.1 P1 family peptidase [Burkholderiaceae bacterium]